MRRFNIITNINNGFGLQREYEILRDLLVDAGQEVTGVHFQSDRCPRADVNLFLETVIVKMFDQATHNWVMPNPEWWLDEYRTCLPDISLILCKTRHAFELFQALAGSRAQYTGFVARDLYQPHVTRKKRFLHVAGNSQMKNTEAILTAWKDLPYRLTVVSPHYGAEAAGIDRVKIYDHVSDEELRRLMNSRQFHLCPSKYEGFGHYIHEALGVGAVVIASNAPPMNELGLAPELLLPAHQVGSLRLAPLHEVTPQAVIDSVHRAAQLSERRIEQISRAARLRFDQEHVEFRTRFLQVIHA
jgi:glycosyltransferase involved in cell wall biosynthesis